MKPIFTLLLILFSLIVKAQIDTIYVTPSGAGNADGKSWYDALPGNKLADKLYAAAPNTMFAVAAGTYYPTTGTNRDSSFRIAQPGIKLLGGYKVWSLIRDPEKYSTILSGNIGASNSNADNSYHVVTVTIQDSKATIDGFTITGGNADGVDSIDIAGVKVSRRNGGGIYCSGKSTSNYLTSINTSVSNCKFISNHSTSDGGGLFGTSYLGVIRLDINRCIFEANKTDSSGGGLGCRSKPIPVRSDSGGSTRSLICTVQYSTFFGNTAVTRGGGINNSNDTRYVVMGNNCVFWNNTASTFPDLYTGGFEGDYYVPYWYGLYNSLFQTPAVNSFGTNNISGDPRFIANNADMYLHLQSCSPAAGMGFYPTPEPTIIYVNKNNRTPGSGTSWSDAYKDLSQALIRANECSPAEIRVAAGTYYPTNGTSRDSSFRILKNGIKLLGGYAANGSGERSIVRNITKLSGNIGVRDSLSDNSYHVLTVAPVNSFSIDSSTLVEGFTIDSGYANANTQFIVDNNTFSPYRNSGAGLYLFCGNKRQCAPYIRSCTFTSNKSIANGGAVFNAASSDTSRCNPWFIACTFQNDSSSRGGAIFDSSSVGKGKTNPTIVNCIFRQNKANNGSAFFDASKDTSSTYTRIVNCSFAGNNNTPTCKVVYSSNIATINTTDTPVVINNSVFGENLGTIEPLIWGNVGRIKISYSYIRFPYVDSSSIHTNNNVSSNNYPFRNSQDFRLQPCSQAVNTGLNNSILPGIVTDISGSPRIVSGIDMGAYELQAQNTIYVNARADSNGTGTSWETAYNNLNNALKEANAISYPYCTDYGFTPAVEIRVAEGTYTPASHRDSSFTIFRSKIRLLGGYKSSGNHERNVNAYPSILSGVEYNNYHVFIILPLRAIVGFDPYSIASIDSTTVIDGFTIRGGNANGDSSIQIGPTLTGTVAIDRDKGGAVYNRTNSFTGFGVNFTSYPKFSNCIFSNNYAKKNGGAVYNCSSTVLNNAGTSIVAGCYLFNCVFTSNSSGGGIVTNFALQPYNTAYSTALNCTFANNTACKAAFVDSANMYSNDQSSKITNCIFQNNTTDILTFHPNNNSSTSTITYSLLQNTNTGQGNIVGNNAVFANSGNVSFLRPGSQAYNSGSNAEIASYGISTDLAGNPRIVHGTVDIGAYENIPIIYVNGNKPTSGNGSSWSQAYNSLQKALDTANTYGYTDIYVAEGIYKPTTNANPDSSFRILRNNIRLFGGFDSSGSGDRNPIANKTILSGDIGTPANPAKSYHVLTIVADREAIDSNTVVDGCILKDGRASFGSASPDNAFAFHNHPIRRGYGGGIYTFAPGNNRYCSPSILNCIIDSNRAAFGGGGMYHLDSSNAKGPLLVNTVFNENRVVPFNASPLPFDSINYYHTGPALFNDVRNATATRTTSLVNCTFFDNSVRIPTPLPIHYNVVTNRAPAGVALPVTNCLFWKNNLPGGTEIYGRAIVKNSLTERYGTNRVDGNIVGRNPMLDTTDSYQRYRLQSCSPAIDGGNNTVVSTIATDLYGKNRIFENSVVDIGAYEFPGERTALQLNYNGSGSVPLDTLSPKLVISSPCAFILTVAFGSNGSTNFIGTPAKAKVNSQQGVGTEVYIVHRVSILELNNGGNTSDIARGSLTLSFTQADFDQFNDAFAGTRYGFAELPKNPGDSAGMRNVIVFHYAPRYNPALDSIVPASVEWNYDQSTWDIRFPFSVTSGSDTFFIRSVRSGGGLPIFLSTFSAQPRTSNIFLNWKTNSEINASHFEIERSSPGTAAFTRVLSVPASNSPSGSNYSIADDKVVPDIYYYYRLKMVDKDGKAAYSNIVRARIEKGERLITIVNATGNELTILNAQKVKQVVLLNNIGQVVISIPVSNQAQIRLPLHSLPPGIYNVVGYTTTGVLTNRVSINPNR